MLSIGNGWSVICSIRKHAGLEEELFLYLNVMIHFKYNSKELIIEVEICKFSSKF